jgi:hypothetical protein
MEFRQSLFWDTDPKRIDKNKNALYIIERILDFGNDKEVSWVYHNYDKNELQKVVDNPRRLMPESKKLWKLILQN